MEAIDRILLYIDRHGTSTSITQFHPHDLSIAYAKSSGEFLYLLDLGTNDLGYFLIATKANSGIRGIKLRAKAWERLQHLKIIMPDSKQAFVAMSFKDNLKSVYDEAINPALVETGYNPIRVDQEQFNDVIYDKIIANIRKSGLIVADLTHASNGVYLEAGFAMGLNIPVIWTCKAENKDDDVHFDVQQFNIIYWKNINDLKERLINRIEATVPIKRT